MALFGEPSYRYISVTNSTLKGSVMYLNLDETCTVVEALASVGCLLDCSGYEHIRLAKNANPKMAVNPDGNLWCFCSGPVLFGWIQVRQSEDGFNRDKFFRVASNMYLVIDIDQRRRLKIVFSD